VIGWKALVRQTRVLRFDELGGLPRGEVLRLSFFSPALGLRRFVGVYQSRGAALPRVGTVVVYLLRGHYSEWFYPEEDGSRVKHRSDRVLTFVDLLEQAVEAGELPPCLLIFPDFGGDDRQGLTLAVDWKDPRLADQGRFVGGGIGAFETSFRQEFLPALEEALGLLNPRRAAIGFSLGGLNACQLALRNPSLFSVVAAYDGSFPYYPIRDDDYILRHPLFDPIFGRPADRAHIKAHSPVWLAQNLPGGQLHRMKFYLASGPESAEPDDSNYYRTRQLIEALEQRGMSNCCPAVVEEGHHDWFTADRFAMSVMMSAFGLRPGGSTTAQEPG
jgi:hypothetical protein